MSRHPREVPVFIPRPSAARPGEPPPWAGRDVDHLDLATIRRRLAGHHPVRGDVPAGSDVRRSGVLVPLFGERDIHIVFGKRSATLPSHRGDLSFPGGRQHPEDPDLAATALREAHEEVGVDPGSVELLGELDHLGTMATRFLIAPFVGAVRVERSSLVPREGEFDRILAVPLRGLVEPGVYHQEIWSGGGVPTGDRGPEDPSVWRVGDVPLPRAVNFFTVDEWDVIWGATATILVQFLDVVTAPD